MTIEDREGWVECHAIDLSSEKCCEVAEDSTPEKCIDDNFYVFWAVFLMMARKYEKYDQKTKYSTKKREMIVLWDKKIAQEIHYIPMR